MDYMRHHDDDHMDDHGDEVSCPMIMTFHTGNCEAILFKGLTVAKADQFALAAIVIFLISIAYEALKFWREKLHNDYIAQKQISCSDSKQPASNRKTIGQLLTQRVHILQTLIQIIQVTVSYALMLIVMTFNVWLVLAVILGATVGYFFFGWIRQRSLDISESCCH